MKGGNMEKKLEIKIQVDEVIEDPTKPIFIELRGEDFNFVATKGGVSFSLDEDNADRLHFHIGCVLQELDMKRKGLTEM